MCRWSNKLSCCYFQPFPSEDGGRQVTDSSGEYGHAKEYSSRAGVRLPLVSERAAYELSLILVVGSSFLLTAPLDCFLAGHSKQVRVGSYQ